MGLRPPTEGGHLSEEDRQMRIPFALAFVSVAVLLLPATSSADSPMDQVAGGGSITAPGSGEFVTADYGTGAQSGPLGESPTGHITDRATVTGFTADEQIFHGDVRDGCLRVVGNRAIVVGRLPEREQFDIPGFGRIEYVALIIEDNGNPVDGHPVDRATDAVLREIGKQRLCSTYDPATAQFFPLDQGNFVVQDAP